LLRCGLMAAHSAAIISMPILLAAARVDHLLDQDRPDFTGHRNNAIQYLFTQLRMITGAEHGTDHLGLRCASKIAGDTRIHRDGFGLIGNIVVGIVGAVIAGWLLPLIGLVLVGGILAAIVNAVIGAVILLLIVGFFRK